MSRVAKNPVKIPQGVEVRIDNHAIVVRGKKGEIYQSFDSKLVKVKVENDLVKFETSGEIQAADALSGTLRALVANCVQGVTEGFQKKLLLVGVGYRAQAQGKKINLSLGFSHPVVYELPDGVSAETPSQTEIIISGFDKQKVGQAAANIRAYRSPEPYKGKGVRYADEHVMIKETAKKK